MTDRLARLYTLLVSPFLTPLYAAAAMLFCRSAFTAYIPLTYRLAVMSSLAIFFAVLPLTVETYMRIKCKIPRGEAVTPRRLRWLYAIYAAISVIGLLSLRTAPLFALAIPLMKGTAALWLVTAAATVLNRKVSREMIFLGGMTLFLGIVAMSIGRQWVAVLCMFIMASGLASTASVRLGGSTLVSTGADYLTGMIVTAAALYIC